MNLINQIELARAAGVSKQAVKQALEKGQLPFVIDGKKKKFDLDNPLIQEYINDDNLNREKAKEKKTSPKTTKKTAITNNKSKKSDKKKTIIKKSSYKYENKNEIKTDTSKFEDLNPIEMKRRQQFADMRKRELQVLILEKKYLPIEFIDGVYIKYIEQLNSTIERLASTFVNDIGKKILSAGEVLPEHIENFTSLVLEATHNNKKTVARLVKKYDPSV